MEKKNKNSKAILFAIIGLALMLIAVVGATFAYFTATVTGDTNTNRVEVTTQNLANLVLSSQVSEIQPVIFPGWLGWQAVQVEATGTTGAAAVYKLELDVVADNANAGELLKDVQYAMCRSTTEKTVPFTAAEYDSEYHSENSTIRHFMTGGSVALPDGCTAIVADNATPANGTKIGSAGKITVNSSQLITVGENDTPTKDYYYIIYRYINNGDQNSALGTGFTVTPLLTFAGTV